MTRTKRANRLLCLLLVLFMVLALLPTVAFAATPAEAGQGFSVTCSGSTFTITRSDTSAAATVKYRTVSQSAVAGIHFTSASGTLTFAAGDNNPKTVTVTERSATNSVDFFYISGSTRTYGFEVLAADNNQILASCQRTLDSSGSFALSSSGLYTLKTATAFTAETKVTDSGFKQAYYPVPLDGYTSGEKNYFGLTGAELRMTVDLEAKESDDGIQYIQIIANNTTGYDSGNDKGNPGTISLSRYLAGFAHKPGTKDTNYSKYTFPLTSAANNCAEIDPAWNFSPYNNTVGKLYTQKFASSARATDGRLILPAGLSTLGIRFDASGDNDDDWYTKNVIANLQAVDSTAPTVTAAYVTNGTYGYRDTVTVALRFSEVVRNVNGTPYLNTNFGNFSYGGGAGTNVLYFTKQMNDSTPAVNGLQITGLANAEKIKDLAGNVFSSFSGYTFSGVAYEGSVSVTINYNNGTGATGDAGRMRLHATYTFPSSTYASQAPTGHEFDCFKVGETSYHAGDTLELTGDLTVDLQWKPIVYTVRFVNWDGTELQSGLVPYGTVPAYTGETPTRPADAQYTYTFSGWTPEPAVYAGDITYTATYIPTLNEYTVTFQNEDGAVLQSGLVAYGVTPAYTGETPTKESTAGQTFTFAGWTPEIVPVTGAATYTATFTDAVRTYTITFEDYDGTVLQSGSVAYGETPAYTGSTPVRPDEGETRYTFTGWTPEIAAVTGEATYTAAYTTAQLYPITLPEGITADKDLAAPGEIVTLTVTDAYTAQLTYTPAGGSPVSIPETEGAYTFAMPAAPVTVGASFSLTWAGLQTLLNAGGTVKLLCDVTAEADSSFLEVPAGVTVTLDLNGHTVDRALTEAVSGGNVLNIYGSLTLGDSSAGGAGRITGGNSTTVCGGVSVSGHATFTMEGGTIDRNATKELGGGVFVNESGTFIMNGGAISGNTAKSGGGVYVYDGTFNMTGGTITSNTASNNGGGVYVDGTFTITGGTITSNTANSGGGVSVSGNATFTMEGGTITDNSTEYYGGGVYVYTDGTFNMTGGTISGNNTSRSYGGGVYNQGTFRVSGSPVVTGNLSGSSPSNVYLYQYKTINLSGLLTDGAFIGVTKYDFYGIFTNGWADMMGTADPAGFFSSDNSRYEVYLSGGEAALGEFHTVTVSDGIEHGTVTADKASAVSGDTVTLTVTPEPGFALETLTVKQGETDVTVENNQFTMPAGDVTVTATFTMTWSSLNAALDNDCVITLPYDITAGSGNGQLIVLPGVTVTLDLNGHTLDRGLSAADAASNGIAVAVRVGASLTVKDSAGGGRITGGNSSGFCGGVHVQGSFIMEGGTIDRNAASSHGGGVYVNGGSFTMTGGTISNNSTRADGGGVYVKSGSFIMQGGTITGNTAQYGGGVEVAPDGTFTMCGGTISNNTAYEGGGVLVSSYSTSAGTFTMTGGTISNNSASANGGGVYVYGTFTMQGGTIMGNSAFSGGGVYNSGTFSVCGSSVVTGNTKKSYGTADNVYLSSGKCITLSGELSGGASLGVTMKDSTGVFTSGWAAQMDTASPADFFISDNSAYAAHLGTGGEAELGQAYAVSVTDGIAHGTVTADRASACAGDTVTLTVTADSGYELDTLNVMQGETAVDVTNNRFTMPAGDVTVSATFKETATEPEFTVHSLLLSGEIGVNFFMDLPEIDGVDYSTSYMEFVVSGKDGKTTTDPYDATHKSQSGKYYGFTCYVNSIQMAEPIKAVFHYGDGQTVEETYSVKDYLNTLDANADMFDASTVALFRALADYGHYAQPFLSAENGWTIGTDYAEMDKYFTGSYTVSAVTSAVADYAISRENSDTDIEKITYTLALDSGTDIRVYFKPVSGYSGSFTVTVDGNTWEAVKHSDGRYLVTIPGISAHLLGTTYTIVATTDAGSATVQVSALSYVQGLLSAYTDSRYQNAAASLYYYYDAARNYQTAHSS